jgi:glycosyltransferase involved in cell wall biosynthesis
MKIYILYRNPFPYGMAPSQHVTCEALGLKAAGADVEVDVFVPPLDKAKDNGLPAQGVFRNIPYSYIHGKFRPSNLIGQLVSRFYNTVRTFFWGVKHFRKGDIVYSYGGDNLTLLLFTWAARLKNSKIVVELVEIPFYGEGKIDRLRRWFDTTFLFPHFDAIVCISHTLMDFARKYVRKDTPMTLLPILVEKDNGQATSDSPYKVPYIIHTGSMNEEKDGISHILNGFAEFKKTDKTNCRLVFTGPDADKDSCKYKSMISDLGIDNSVDLLGMIASREELLNIQHHATMSIVYKVDNIQTRFCFATKIGEILMAGVPLVTTDVSEQKHYLHDKESAFIVKAEDELELSQAIHYVLAHPEEARQVGLKGREIAQTDFNPIDQGEKLKKFFDSL